MTILGPQSVGALLQAATERLRAAGSESARLDAEVLLGHALRVDRTTLLAHPEALVGDGARETFAGALQRRATGEPVAYIRGLKEFHSVALSVDARALIPRPETELLVDLALAHVRAVLTSAPREPGAAPFVAWDVGTGSGAIAVSLAASLRRLGYAGDVRIHASDVSQEALDLALENAAGQGVADLLTFDAGDLLSPAPASGPVDLLIANLPYVASEAVDELPVAASFEPRLALDGGASGLDVIRRLLPGLPAALAEAGLVLLEIGSDQGEALTALVAEVLPGWGVAILEDLSGRPRAARLAPPGR
jgi:release factor glutamine methyltransferase